MLQLAFGPILLPGWDGHLGRQLPLRSAELSSYLDVSSRCATLGPPTRSWRLRLPSIAPMTWVMSRERRVSTQKPAKTTSMKPNPVANCRTVGPSGVPGWPTARLRFCAGA
jgi:hypothetical protein